MLSVASDSVALFVAALGCRPVSPPFQCLSVGNRRWVGIDIKVGGSGSVGEQWVTWRCRGGVVVVLFSVSGKTICYIPSSMSYFHVSVAYALPSRVPEGVGLIGQCVLELVGGEYRCRVLLFDCTSVGGVECRYRNLRSWFECGSGLLSVQWVGFFSALSLLLRDPAAYGVSHDVDGYFALDSVNPCLLYIKGLRDELRTVE